MSYEILRFPTTARSTPTGTCSSRRGSGRSTSRSAIAPRAMRIRTDERRPRVPRDRRAAVGAHAQGRRSACMGAMGDTAARPGPDRRYMDHMPFGAGDAARATRAARPREPREERPLSDDRSAVGVRGRGSRDHRSPTSAPTTAGSPTSAATRRASGADRAPDAARSRRARPTSSSAPSSDGCRGALPGALHAQRGSRTAIRTTTCCSRRRASSTCRSASTRPTSRRGRRRCASSASAARGEFFYNVMLRQGVQQAFLSFFALGTLDRFPALRLGVLEAGSGWIGAFLDRMDAVHETISASGIVARAEAAATTSAASASSPAIPTRRRRRYIIDHVGADCFMWATDYPHPDHPSTWVPALERFVAPLDAATRAKVLGRERRAHLPAVAAARATLCEHRVNNDLR